MTYTGAASYGVSESGSVTFIPPYDAITTITLDTVNDIGPRQCSVQVTTTNTPPAIFPTTTTGSEDAPQIDGTLSGVDYNPGDSIFFERRNPLPTNGSVNVDASGSFQYFPNPDFCGTDTFNFRAYDQLNNYASPVTQTVQVECINDTPVAMNDSGTGTSGVPLMLDVLANDTDPDSPYQMQTFTLTGYSLPANGTLAINANQLEYTPNGGFTGTEVFTYIMVDQSGSLSNSGTVTVNVLRSNTPPSVSSSGYTINEDQVLSDALTGSDGEGDVLSYTATVLPTNGVLNLLANGSFTYTPNANYFGADSFQFRANDGMANSPDGTITLTIDPVLDTPVATNDSYTFNQDVTSFVPVMANDTDPDSVSLTLTGYTNPTNGNIVVSGTGFDYTPNALYVGPDSFTYRIVDGDGLISGVATVNLTISSTNAAPVAGDDAFVLNEDTSLLGVLSGSDLEMATLTYVIDTLPVNGTLVASSTGGFSFTPTANFAGVTTFTFHVNDGAYDSNIATVTLTVNNVNDAPVAAAASLSVNANTASSSGNLLSASVSATDIDSGSLTYSAATLPVNGVLVLSSTGSFTYAPALGFVGTDSFTFLANDGFLDSTAATVTITVSVPSSGGGGGSSPAPSNVGPGGGGGGGGGGAALPGQSFTIVTAEQAKNIAKSEPKKNTVSGEVNTDDEEIELDAAPESEPKQVFVLLDPTGGLLGQLLLGRSLGATPLYSSGSEGPMIPSSPLPVNPSSVFDSLDSVVFDDQEGPVILRQLLRVFLEEARQSADPELFYAQGIAKITELSMQVESPRMSLTISYILRVLEQHKARYEEMLMRDVLSRTSLKSDEEDDINLDAAPEDDLT
jgi:hypothetical protein